MSRVGEAPPPDRGSVRPGAWFAGLLFLSLSFLFGVTPLAGQSGGLFLDGGLSHSLSPSGSEIDPSTYLLGGIRLDQRPLPGTSLFASLYGGKSLERTTGDWGALAAGSDVWTSPTRSLELGLGAWASAFAVGPPFEYRAVTAEIVPRAVVEAGAFRLGLRGRGGVGTSNVRVRRISDPLPLVTPAAAVTTHLWYYGAGPEVRLPLGPAMLGVGGTLYDSDVGGYGEGFVRLTAGTEAFQAALDLRAWETPGGNDVSGGITLRVPFGPGWSVQATGGRAEPDPLLQTPAAVQASFVASRRLLSLGEPDQTLYEMESASDGVRVRFSLERADAENVQVVGDFSGWSEVEMRSDGDTWSTAVTMSPGLYHFGFLVDGEWFVPEEAPGRIRDEWGRVNATLVVLKQD